jgi:hypothetical protein
MAATAHATPGADVPAAGTPLDAVATRRSTATPIAVPSWAAVLMMPDARNCEQREKLAPNEVCD